MPRQTETVMGLYELLVSNKVGEYQQLTHHSSHRVGAHPFARYMPRARYNVDTPLTFDILGAQPQHEHCLHTESMEFKAMSVPPLGGCEVRE